jgi:hypothetical protein
MGFGPSATALRAGREAVRRHPQQRRGQLMRGVPAGTVIMGRSHCSISASPPGEAMRGIGQSARPVVQVERCH